jgi:hypothetical protein
VLSPVVFWFRRDLRLSDNRAPMEAARRGDGNVVPAFAFAIAFAIDPELAALAPTQCPRPGAVEGLFAPAGHVAPMVVAVSERNDDFARLDETRHLARVPSREGGVA